MCVLCAILLQCVAYMSIDLRFWDIVEFKPNKSETIVLDTLGKIKYGNAYQIWKSSGLKYYPTVLRTIKKLQKRKLVGTIEKRSGLHGETLFSSTIQGILVYYVFNNKDESIFQLMKEESGLFNQLSKLPIAKEIALDAAKDIILNSKKNSEVYIDDAIKSVSNDLIHNDVFEYIFNSNKDSLSKILELSKIEGLKPIVLKNIEDEKNGIAIALKNLNELKTLLNLTGY